MAAEQQLWKMSGLPLAYWASALVLLFLIWQLAKIGRALYQAKKENRIDHFWHRLGNMFVGLLLPRRLFQDRYHGFIHTLIFWGFLFLIPGTVDTLSRGFSGGNDLTLLQTSIFLWAINWWDVIAVFPVAGVLWALLRRFIRPPRRFASSSVQVYLILLLIFFLLVVELVRRGVELSLAGGAIASVNPVRLGFSWLVSAFGLGSPELSAVHSVLWWTHFLLLAGFVIYIPLSKHLHLLLCPFNLLFKDNDAGALPAIDLTDNEINKLGVSTYGDFTWKQRLDFYTCANCGRCEERCPAHISGKTLSPRKLVQNLRHGANATSLPVTKQEIWACTTCGACQAECPSMVEHLKLMVDLRRGSLDDGGLQPAGARALENIWRWGNPWGESQTRRTQWLGAKENSLRNRKGLLFWVGCTASFDPDGQEIAKAMVDILSRQEVEFFVLGPDELCCGDPARRMGEEALFQELARENIRKFEERGIDTVVTTCPHCYHMFKREYPKLGARLKVLHHTQLLGQVMADSTGEREPGESGGNPGWTMTFHDPCYLGRYNDLYEDSRKLIQNLVPGNLVEMKDSVRNAMCCGGGGGQLWVDIRDGERINNLRFHQAGEAGAEIVVTACPVCKIMLKSAKDSLNNETIMVKDIAELVLTHM